MSMTEKSILRIKKDLVDGKEMYCLYNECGNIISSNNLEFIRTFVEQNRDQISECIEEF